MDRDDRELFERSIRAATSTATGAQLDERLVELGWPDALSTDPATATSVLFEAQGQGGSTSSALDRVLAHGLGLATDPARPAPVVLPPVGTWEPPGQLGADGLRVRGLATAALGPLADATPVEAVEVVAVVATDVDAATDPGSSGHAGEGTVVVSVAPSELDLRPIEGVDPGMGLLDVRADGARPIGPPRSVPTSWAAGVMLARLALAHELVGVSRTMLRLAREHAVDRVQFGVPIASFQAVRHRLAETLVAVETAAAAAEGAWLDLSPTTALVAKAVAGREARVAMKHCQQVLAGIGFTTEHDLHLYVRRALLLDALLGTSERLTRLLGAELVTTRRLPPLLPL
jgi:hypothetical protein